MWLSIIGLWLVSSPLNDLKTHFQDSKGFRAEFTQDAQQEFFEGEALRAKGFVEFQKPHSLRWVYEEPDSEKKELIYDGEALWILREGKKEKLSESTDLNLQNAFSFLWGEADLKNFLYTPLSQNTFHLEPKKDSGFDFKKMHIELKGSTVSKVEVWDQLEGVSRFHFKNWTLR